MALNDDIALFSRVPLFQGIGDDKLRLIAFGAERRRIAAGQVLFRQSAAADCGFVVAGGSFQLTTHTPGQAEKQVGTAALGALLSELAMISPVERKFTATAVEDSEVIRINRPLFRRMLEEYPEIASLVETRIRDNLTTMIKRMETLSGRFA